jgi:acetolactate synthase-1/3 small subunit
MFAYVKGDVYPIEHSDSFTVNQVLDAQWGFLIDEDVRWFKVFHCP